MRIPVVLAVMCIAFLILMLSSVFGVEAASVGPSLTVTASPSVFNPSSGTTITYTLSNTYKCVIVLTITDGSGNAILRVNNYGVSPGTYTYVWDGKDNNGNQVPDGNYKITVNAANIIADGTSYIMHSVAVYDDATGYHVYLTLSDSPQGPGLMDVWYGTVTNIGLPVPMGLDVDGTHFYVTDYDGDNTTIISSGGRQVLNTPHKPIGIAADSTGNIYVTEFNSNNVQIFDKNGNSLRNIGVYAPYDVAVDGAGKIYVTSNWGNVVKIFNSDGSIYKTIGVDNVQGTDNSHFNQPEGIALDGSGNIYVADTFNQRIQVFNPEGQYRETIIISGSNGYNTYPEDIAFDSYGNMYIIDNGNLIVSYVPVQTTVTLVTAPPAVTGISPISGPTAGGTTVTITGTGFTGATAVDFGSAAATSFTVNSGTQITAVSQAGSGTVHVTVTTPGGTSTTGLADQFTYAPIPTVTGIIPVTGPVAGGTTVIITGTGFTGATAVDFGSIAASITAITGTQITAVSPAGSVGMVDVTVTTPGGTSATSSADQFTYMPVPTVTGISPSSGPTAGGTTVTITGTGFYGATAVRFGGTAATSFTVITGTQITAVSPIGSVGMVDVTVTTPGATSVTGSADQFTYILGPVENMNTTLTYLTIQSAIDDAGPGDWIQVPSGTYNENVFVNKRLTLVGKDTVTGQPIIYGNGPKANTIGILITANGVTVQGFNVTNSWTGIEIDGSNDNVTGNTANNNLIWY